MISENAVKTVKASNVIDRHVFFNLITVQYAVHNKLTHMMCFSVQINTVNSFYTVSHKSCNFDFDHNFGVFKRFLRFCAAVETEINILRFTYLMVC